MKALLLGAAVWLSSCTRDVQLCDASSVQAKTLEGLAVCQAKGYEWAACPDRPRLLRELERELSQCSRN